MLMKHFFLACVGSKMAKNVPNDRVNRAKHVPLSDDWNNNLHQSREQNLTCDPQLGGVGSTLYNGLYGEVPPEGDTFFRLQVYERVGILLVEEYERVRKSVIWVYERAHRANR